MQKVLVTGATGFVGAHVARELAANGYAVRALARTNSSRRLLEDVPVEWSTGDLRDAASLQAALEGCAGLFHCAADYRLWSRNPQELYDSNVEGTRRLLMAARKTGADRVVYTSSVGALGLPPEGGSGNEETPTSLEKMIGHYKRSKFLAEEVAVEAAFIGMNIVIVNPSTPVGPGDIKPTPTGKMIVDFLNGKMPAYLDTGLNLVAVEDVAAGHRLAYEKGERGRKYILGNRNMTLHSILQLLGEVTGLPAPQVQIPYPVAYAAALASTAAATITRAAPGISLESVRMAHTHMFFDGSRAVRELGMPQTPIEDALRRAAAWFLGNEYVTNSRRAAICGKALAS